MPVRAAGGVVLREGPSGVVLVMVHRPRYDDWSLPKGKLLPGESDRDAALREVEEETGLGCELGEELPEVSYVDSLGRPKVVRYWTMRPVAERAFRPTPEVDEVRWVSLQEASDLLTYPHDRELVRHVMART
ncbi:MAG TPA: NUDIX hydrolase [Actinomycetota bacterium]|jgi:8-oxo-dGTP diphosphatase|nr:NUDIX hydrolase [Actinomycetota bacterium]